VTPFGRQVVLQIGTLGAAGRSFRDLRVSFRVEQTKSSTPNKAQIDVYGLAPESVSLLQLRGAVVRLQAGYEAPRLIFTGSPIKNGVRLEKLGPERVLHIEATDDGGRAWQSSRVSLAFATQTSARQVFDAVALELGIARGPYLAVEDVQLPHGLAMSGPAREILDRVAASIGATWMITDGVLEVVPRGNDIGQPAVVLSAAGGNLVGSPVPKDDGLEVTSLLEPSLRPGRLFVLQSEQFNGAYVARDVTFVGDTHGQAFYSTVTGKPR
jgi:hypothetical protein